eukprot:gnl/TRDRNA2_/TRDRNA2_177003_c0_seq14.p1 gnl/TRDRNA2_/TRDRNA2_177003_c0~~gnl/TRDRNA2_/TRDRNA2_177003_c0_seq14.p1  ORF type:complete len:483 (-),score=46.59 gnl/TRDRNA2_/TRDRNA2_177003_c0_seq14:336-1784(-)
MLVTSWVWRRTLLLQWQSRGKKMLILARIVETIMYAALCASIFALAPSLVNCVPLEFEGTNSSSSGHSSSEHARRLSGGTSDLTYVQYVCPEGEYNQVATLLLSGPEPAIKHLFSRQALALDPVKLTLVLFVFIPLAGGMPGISVPMGLFVPSLLIGGLMGRIVGEVMRKIDPQETIFAASGVYALLGSAAMLGGFTHMTIAIVALLVEATNDLSLISPLMLSIMVAHVVARSISHQPFDELILMKKGVPFLDADVPEDYSAEITAIDLCEAPCTEALLSPEPTIREVESALELKDAATFPVINEKQQCIGLATRSRLEAALKAYRTGGEASMRLSGFSDTSSALTPEAHNPDDLVMCNSNGYLADVDKELGLNKVIKHIVAPFGKHQHVDPTGSASLSGSGSLYQTIPVTRIMDPSPFMVFEDMPVSRFYSLFAKAGVMIAVVVTKTGEFCGIITRSHLISGMRNAHMPQKSSNGCRRQVS